MLNLRTSLETSLFSLAWSLRGLIDAGMAKVPARRSRTSSGSGRPPGGGGGWRRPWMGGADREQRCGVRGQVHAARTGLSRRRGGREVYGSAYLTCLLMSQTLKPLILRSKVNLSSDLAKSRAHRRNALRSTGPRTDAGKRRSRCNAVRHGLTAETVIEVLEDPEDYKAFELSVTAGFDAQTAVERELVLRLASLLWRLRRATAMETGLLQIQSEILREIRQALGIRTKDGPPLLMRSFGSVMEHRVSFSTKNRTSVELMTIRHDNTTLRTIWSAPPDRPIVLIPRSGVNFLRLAPKTLNNARLRSPDIKPFTKAAFWKPGRPKFHFVARYAGTQTIKPPPTHPITDLR